MKYILVWIVVMTLCHFVMCGFAAFLNWDISYFWLGNWDASGRFIYMLVLCFGSFAVTAWSCEKIQKLKNKVQFDIINLWREDHLIEIVEKGI